MSYGGNYLTVLKKLFPPYWRLLVHFFLQCIAENKGGFDQLNKTQTCAIVALVNEWGFNFSAFIFDSMKKMLEDPKKRIFMLYPRFLQMILDDKHPELVKGLNYINLKPIGSSCFENACRNKRAKHHNFEGKFALEKHGRFADIVPAAPVAPVPPQINAQIAEEHDVQPMQQVAGNEKEVEELDSESETGSSEEETYSKSEVEIVMPEKEKEAIREPVPMNAENLAALLLSLQGRDGNTPSVSTVGEQDVAATSHIETEIEAITNDAEEAAKRKQRTDSAPDDVLSGPLTDLEPTPSSDPQPDPLTEDASKKKSTEDPDLGVRFEAGSSSGAGNTEHDEAAFRYATEKRQVFESDSDSDEDVNVKRLKRRVVQDDALKEAQISSLQSQMSNRDLTIDQLQGDLGMLMFTVYDLKAKLEKKFGNEFTDKEDEQFYVGRTEPTPKQRATAHVVAEAEREAALNAYLAAEPKKRSGKPKKKKQKQGTKQILVMKNQDMNPLDENFQLKDPTKRPDIYVM
ncbi:hypothetical protein Hanom_Chr07g00626311 [Helianthus anomalus]